MDRERMWGLEDKYLEAHPAGLQPAVFANEGEVTERFLCDNPLIHLSAHTIAANWNPAPIKMWPVNSLGDDDGPAMSLGELFHSMRKEVREHPAHGFGVLAVGKLHIVIGVFELKE